MWLQEAPGQLPKAAQIPPFLKTNADHISGYVYAGVRGRVRGNSAETQPRLKHKGQLGGLFPTGVQQRLFVHVKVCVCVCVCNRSPSQLNKQMLSNVCYVCGYYKIVPIIAEGLHKNQLGKCEHTYIL